MKSLSKLLRAGVVIGMLTLPMTAMAAENAFQNAGKMVNDVGGAANVNSKPLPELVGKIINVALSLLGIVLLGYLLLGGYKYMTAQGDSKKVDEALGTIRTAIIGLVIIVAAFAISTFVLGSLVNATVQ